MKFLIRLLLILGLCLPARLLALDRFVIPEGQSVFGEILYHTLSGNETLLDVARAYDLGYNQIVLANPGLDPWIPPAGHRVLIPKEFVLPEGPHTGILVNLPEMRLYYFRTEGGVRVVYTAPIGIGTEGRLTTQGIYTVYRKKEHPYWHVPESIRKEDPTLPEVVPPGPENPLGDYALYLSRGAYAIHGTNRPWGIGRRVSHGCIRLYPEDIKALFPLVPVGTPVRVLYQPVKLGIREGRVYLQAFPDIEKRLPDPVLEVVKMAARLERETGYDLTLDLFRVREVLRKPDGVPREVGEVR
ncbi:L,D-transpeptidase family protein [Thermosulfurimonas sp. F29]|uniref:L,D-transpeptidase family protein n=1 Tax=Thermosulfurimonas sp. F29 TaxID=2867247 RepID=UPI001C82E994|nr:L,D-transpeptidase family protein [Thermosulfurimonas sp. F29]MBX6423769.1 L,D-transpeptidase family protein [Thermosulfurimonas sp. F29]